MGSMALGVIGYFVWAKFTDKWPFDYEPRHEATD